MSRDTRTLGPPTKGVADWFEMRALASLRRSDVVSCLTHTSGQISSLAWRDRSLWKRVAGGKGQPGSEPAVSYRVLILAGIFL